MALDLLTTIELDMQDPYSSSSIVHVNQYDTAGRIKAQLLNGGVKWQVPQGAKPVVMFKKTDNIGGFYDVTELNPSTAAVTVDGSDSSIIYITLDQQTTTTATPTGQYVNMQVAFYQNSARLSTFAFYMQVAESVVTSGDIHSNWLFNILSQEIAQILTDATTPEFISQWLENNITQETGYVIDDSLTIHGAASDAQATGKMVTVSDTNPGVTANKVWVKKTPSEIVVPTEDEVEDLRNALTISDLLVTETDVTEVGYIDNYGNFVSTSGYHHTDYIPCNAKKATFVGKIASVASGYKNLWCYDKDKNALGGVMYVPTNTDSNITVDLVDGTEFIVFDVADSASNKFLLIRSIESQIDSTLTSIVGAVGHTYPYLHNRSISMSTPTTINTESNYECVLVECNEGDVFYVRGKGGNSTRLWFFSDANGALLSSALAQALETEYVKIIAPANAKYLSVNSNYTMLSGALLKGDGIIQNEIDDINTVINRVNIEQVSVKHNPSGSYPTSFGWNGTQGYICSNLIDKYSYIGEITFKNTLNSNVTFGFAYIDRSGKCLKVFDCTGATGTKITINYITPAEGYFVVILKSVSAVIVAYSTSEVSDAIPCRLAFYNGLIQGEYPVEGNTYSISTSPTVIYPSFTIPTEQVNYQFLITRAEQIFYNKKVAFLGDSLTAGYIEGGGYVERPYPTVVKEDLHLGTIQNLGVASTSISPGGNPTRAMCDRYTDISSDTDYIVIMGGTNDHVYGTPIGEITDITSETFYGGLYTLFEGIRHDYPNARLIMCTPIQKSWVGNNTVSKKFIDYVDAIREMCEYCSVICLDLYAKSGLTFHLPEMKKYFLNPDQSQGGLHCNQAGYEYLGHKVALLLPTVI